MPASKALPVESIIVGQVLDLSRGGLAAQLHAVGKSCSQHLVEPMGRQNVPRELVSALLIPFRKLGFRI